MKTFAIVNHKGGPGKTTTTVNLAGALGQLGYSVLVIDVDAQGDISSVFNDHHENLELTVADLFNDTGSLLSDLIQPTQYEKIFLVPADERLNDVDETHNFKDERSTRLLEAIDRVADQFDIVLFDCAGKAHLTGFAAMAAADEVIVPVEASRFAVRNLASVHREFCSVQQSYNSNINMRLFLSKVERGDKTVATTRLSLEKAFGREHILKTEIPLSRAYKTAISIGKPITYHSKRSKASLAVTALAKEVMGVQNEQVNHAKDVA